MAQRVVEGLRGLAGQCAARLVGDRAGDHDRQAQAVFVEDLLAREYGCLRVEGVEDRLDEEEVDPAGDQAARRLRVGLHQPAEVDVAKPRVVHVRREARRAVRGTEHAGDEARLLRRPPRPPVGALAREPGRGLVELADECLHAVVRHRHAVGVERVRLEDVGAGLEVRLVDVADHIRPRDDEQVVVPLEVARPGGEALAPVVGLRQPVALDHGSHGAVEDQDPLGEQGAEGVRVSGHR